MTKGPIQFLMILLAALSAFTLPQAKSSVREVAAGLFAPVSWPVRTIGLAIGNRLSPPVETDVLSGGKTRSADELRRQNAELLTRLLSLETQLDDLKQLSAQYQQLGDLRKLVQPAAVIAGPVGNRQVLTIGATGLKSVREGLTVVHPLGFVGTIYAVSPGQATARVLLATDPQSHVTARIVRVISRNGSAGVTIQPIKIPAPLVDGDGTAMAIHMLAARDVRGVVQIGDLVVLDEPKLPPALRGLRIGTVSAIKLPPSDAGHATIAVEPTGDLAQLREVLVVNK